MIAPPRQQSFTIYALKKKEERNRLLYVAMTRAEKWLIVAGAGKVQDASACWHSQITEGEAAGRSI